MASSTTMSSQVRVLKSKPSKTQSIVQKYPTPPSTIGSPNTLRLSSQTPSTMATTTKPKKRTRPLPTTLKTLKGGIKKERKRLAGSSPKTYRRLITAKEVRVKLEHAFYRDALIHYRADRQKVWEGRLEWALEQAFEEQQKQEEKREEEKRNRGLELEDELRCLLEDQEQEEEQEEEAERMREAAEEALMSEYEILRKRCTQALDAIAFQQHGLSFAQVEARARQRRKMNPSVESVEE